MAHLFYVCILNLQRALQRYRLSMDWPSTQPGLSLGCDNGNNAIKRGSSDSGEMYGQSTLLEMVNIQLSDFLDKKNGVWWG